MRAQQHALLSFWGELALVAAAVAASYSLGCLLALLLQSRGGALELQWRPYPYNGRLVVAVSASSAAWVCDGRSCECE